MEKKINLSVILPCYNEEKIIYKNLLKTVDIIEKFEKDFEIICVNDGSKDKSEEEINKAVKKDKRIKLVSYKNNKGKGNALKKGTNAAIGEYVAFVDSDLELSPSFIKKYLKIMKDEDADVVIASKMHKDSVINYPFFRRVLSFGYYIFLKILFNLKVKDTQTGLKVFKSECIKKVMPLLKTKGFAFDIEMLAIINQLDYKIVDAPIKLDFTRDHAMGRIKIKDVFKMFSDTLKIFVNVRVRKEYRDSIVEQKRLYYFIGTEAELMKMWPTILESKKRGYHIDIISNGQNIVKDSYFLNLIDEKISIDLTKYVPKKKGMKSYLIWFIKTRRLGIKVMKKELKRRNKNNCLLFVHGDTLSTLMGSMIAKKVKINYVHVESGFRSYNWFSPFPEEIDRYFSSKRSVINFCQKKEAKDYAEKAFKGEAICTVYNTGIETLFYALNESKKRKIKLPVEGKYFVFAIHRQENLLNKKFMKEVTKRVIELSRKMKCVFIYHEQTKDALEKFELWDDIKNAENIKIIGRQQYVEFINIIDHALFVVGDGCGNQQEFYYMGKPYLIMRTRVEENTEGLMWNAKPFKNDFSNINKFYSEYKKYTKDLVKISVKPSKIIMNKIDEYFKNTKKS